MSRPLPVHFTSAMTAGEVIAALREARPERVGIFHRGTPPDRTLRITEDELLDEVRVWLTDCWRFRRELSQPASASTSANLAASLRDARRRASGDYRGLGHRAALIGHWLTNHAARPSREESLAAAMLAAEGAIEEAGLAKELRTLVQGQVDGSIRDDRFVRMIKAAEKRTRQIHRANEPAPPIIPTDAIPVTSVLSAFNQHLLERAPRLTQQSLWEAFQAFAFFPISGVSQGHDLLLFEYLPQRLLAPSDQSRVSARLVRQFEVLDADGIPDHLEQLSCDWTFDVSDPKLPSRTGTIWSDRDAEAWFRDVEADPVFTALLRRTDVITVSTDLVPTD